MMIKRSSVESSSLDDVGACLLLLMKGIPFLTREELAD
jgi:hypothetical protein